MSDHDKINTRDIFQIKGLKDEPMKSHVEYIDALDQRVKYLYEALSNAENGSDCAVTVYVYQGDSEDVLYAIERKGTWNGAWDTEANDTALANAYPYTIEGFYKG